MRLQKFLARAGVASRRASEELIAAGRVRVDGVTVTRPGVRVDPERSVVEVDGRRVGRTETVWLAMHKPPGYLSTRRDPEGRPTIYDLLPPEHQGLFHVGRLDYLSEGLLLLTNDGEAANALLHPSRRTPRRYEVKLGTPVPDDLADRLLAGVELEDGLARASRARLEPGEGRGERRLLVELREGRNREIRRLMEAVGVEVRGLRRVAIGRLRLGELRRGEWRRLTPAEVRALARPGSAARPAGRAPRGEPAGKRSGRPPRGTAPRRSSRAPSAGRRPRGDRRSPER